MVVDNVIIKTTHDMIADENLNVFSKFEIILANCIFAVQNQNNISNKENILNRLKLTNGIFYSYIIANKYAKRVVSYLNSLNNGKNNFQISGSIIKFKEIFKNQKINLKSNLARQCQIPIIEIEGIGFDVENGKNFFKKCISDGTNMFFFFNERKMCGTIAGMLIEVTLI